MAAMSSFTPAGFPLIDHLLPGQLLRAGSTVTHPHWAEQGLPPTAVVVEILEEDQVELDNGQRWPLHELQPVATGERWIQLQGVVVPYLLSDQGKVVSLRFSRKPRERLLRGSMLGRYPSMSLLLEQRAQQYPVARLVAQHFLPPPAEARLTQVLHLDQNPLNVHYTNLQWVDKAETQDLTVASLLRRHGENHYRAKLTPEKVGQIRQRAAEGEQLTALASEFGLSTSAISHIVQGRTWRLPPAPDSVVKARPVPRRITQSDPPLPKVSETRRTPAGVPLVDYLLPGEEVRAGATVTHPHWAEQGLPATENVVEVHEYGVATLTNDLCLPISQLERVETQEQWVYVQGSTTPTLLSDQGKVVSLRHYDTPRVRLLRVPMRKGQPNLVVEQGRHQYNRRVALLVAQHFLPPPPTRKKSYVVARDGNPLNLRVTNLEWALPPKPPQKVVRKPVLLSDEQVAEVLLLHQQGQTIAKLAQHFGVSTSTIGRITYSRRTKNAKG